MNLIDFWRSYADQLDIEAADPCWAGSDQAIRMRAKAEAYRDCAKALEDAQKEAA